MTLFTPPIKFHPCHYPKWFTSETRHHLHKVHSLRKCYKHNLSISNISKLSVAESVLQSDITDACINYQSELINNFAHHNDFKIYKYISSICKEAKIPKVLTYASQNLTSPIDKINAFNICCHSNFNTNTSDISFENLPYPDKSLCSFTITKHEVYTGFADPDSTKAMGGDGIPPLFLKHCVTALVDPVHYLFS